MSLRQPAIRVSGSGEKENDRETLMSRHRLVKRLTRVFPSFPFYNAGGLAATVRGECGECRRTRRGDISRDISRGSPRTFSKVETSGMRSKFAVIPVYVCESAYVPDMPG